MWQVPVKLEQAVHAAASEVVGAAALATGALTRAIVDRSRRYTSDRAELARPSDRVGDLAARAAFFTIADAMKIGVPLAELVARDALPPARPLRVIDLGAGCGAMTLGLLAALPPIALDVLAIDHDRDALRIASAACRAFAADRVLTLTTRAEDVARASLPPAELIVMGSVLNELAPERALAVVEQALAALTGDGAVIIIEPALRETSRALHAIRDQVIARGSGHVFAPCTRRAAPCTALVDPRDWCHEDRALALPPRTAELARLTHLRDGGMRFSYLVLRKQPLSLVEDPAAWRIVSAPFPAKGKLELIGCSEHGRVRLRLLRRHRNAGNRAFEDADRGSVLAISCEPEPGAALERLEIDAETTVRTPGETPGL
ncbi:MAG: small ribosomal subunit Rsm22 family protein [Kofleriaceae bacterium]